MSGTLTVGNLGWRSHAVAVSVRAIQGRTDTARRSKWRWTAGQARPKPGEISLALVAREDLGELGFFVVGERRTFDGPGPCRRAGSQRQTGQEHKNWRQPE